MQLKRLFCLVACLAGMLFSGFAAAKVIPGKPAGQVSVTLSGSSQYLMPLEFPTGTAGMGPKLFLSYDSNSGPGSFGLGWSLTGLTQITRINRTTLVDGFPATVSFDDASDAFALDGVRLVQAPEGASYFAKSIDDQTRVRRDGQHFVSKTKAGLTLFYGESENSRIKTVGGRVLAWAVSRIEDTFGNQIVFLYDQKNGDWGPRRIFWTVHRSQLPLAQIYDEASLEGAAFAHAAFEWRDAANLDSIGFAGGEETQRSRYVAGIASFVGGKEFRRYGFEYEETGRFGARVLKSIREQGAAISADRDEYGQTRFTYTSFVPTWNEAKQYTLPTDFGSITSVGSGFRMIDVDGDNDEDLLYSAYVDGLAVRRSFRKETIGWQTANSVPPPPVEADFSSSEAGVDPIVFFDVNADGKKDILVSRSVDGNPENATFVQGSGIWQKDEGLAPPFTLVDGTTTLAQALEVDDGGKSKLLVWGGDGSAALFWVENNSWSTEAVGGTTAIDQRLPIRRGDFRCDGSVLLAAVTARGDSVSFFQIKADASGAKIIDRLADHALGATISRLALLRAGACAKLATLSGSGADSRLAAISVSADGSVVEETGAVDFGTFGNIEEIFAIDIRGGGEDGIGLLVDAGLGETNLSFLSFDGTSAWQVQPDFDYVPQDALSIVDAAYRLEPIDIDSDGKEDILLLPTSRGVVARALINNGSGFDNTTSLVPDVEFAREGAVGASPQFVDINADGLTDLIGHHIDKDGKVVIDTAQINTSGGWTGVEALRLPSPISSEKGGTVGAFVDFNSDGIADFVYAGNDQSKWGAWTIEFDTEGNPLRWAEVPGYKLPQQAKLSDENFGDLGVRFFDLNADGKVDFVVSRREANGQLVRFAALNTGSGWSPDTPKYHPPLPFVSRHIADVRYETKSAQGDYYRDLRVNVSDVNGDGLTDLLFWYGFQQPSGTNPLPILRPRRDGCLNNPTFEDAPNASPIYKDHPISSARYCAGVYYLSEGGWAAGQDAHFPPVQLDLNIVKDNASIDIVDVNGDGIVDLIPARLVGDANEYREAYLNTGKGWKAHAGYAIPAEALSADTKLTGHRAIDLNGDGLIDMAYSRPGKGGTILNSGSRFLAPSSEFAPPKPFINDKGEDLGVRFVDVDGNGMPDFLESFRNKDGAITQSAYLNSGKADANGLNSLEDRADMLKTVTNGMGHVTTVDYRSLLTPRGAISIHRDDFYTPSPISSFPTISYVPTMYAVWNMAFEDSDGSRIGTEYHYKGFRFDVQASTPLGFERRIARSFVVPAGGSKEFTDIVEEVELYQDYFRNGRAKRETAVVAGVTTADMLSEYSVFGPTSGVWPKRVVSSSTSSITADLHGLHTGTTTQFFAYDQHNNAEKICIEYGDGSRTLTDNAYDSAPDLLRPDIWFLGRLTRAEVTHLRPTASVQCSDLLAGLSGVPPGEVLTNTATFEYDVRRNAAGQFLPESTGVLNVEVANAGHPLQVSKTYNYDKFGNVIEERAETADLLPRSSTARYSNDGRFVMAKANALGQTTSFEYDPLLGVVTRTTDPNGISLNVKYDGFGRAVETISPTGVSASDLRELDDTVEVHGRRSKFRQSQRVGDLAETVTYYDFQGRTLRVDQEGFSGRRVYQDTQYDVRGRAVATSLPYFADVACAPDAADPCIYWSQTRYDILDRPELVIAPDGGQTRTEYVGLVTVVIDPAGKTFTKRVNEKGLTVETIDHAQGTLRFIYGPGDRLRKTVRTVKTLANDVSRTPPTQELEWTHRYDQVGNKIASVDPDLGEWNYRYNGFGEIVWQRDAKGQITTINYDELGRPLNRHMPDRLDRFAYDVAAFGIGKPATISNSQGYEESYSYDRYGRMQRKAVRLDGELYSTGVTYDEYDRPIEASYPGNYTVWNEYDAQGFLDRVLTNDPLRPFNATPGVHWVAKSRDQYGRVTSEEVGNGIVTRFDYDPRKGNLKNSNASKDGKVVTDLTFEYDLVGNLDSKTDGVANSEEKYLYDDLYRLTDWIVDGKTAGRYRFDGAGRILSKSGVGEYSYGAAGPAHGVSSITTANGRKLEYAYDANGNLESGPKGHLAYYANNSVRLIYASDDRWSQFRYAPDGSRVFHHYSETRDQGKKHSVNVVQTISIGAYERISDLGGAFIVKPGGFQRHRLYVSSDTGVVAVLEHSTEFDPLHADPDFKKLRAGTALASAVSGFTAHYLHKDHLGSIIRITDERGATVAGYEYDPWGKKTQTVWVEKGKEDFAENTFRRGFTGHEHLDNLDLIHMNGRVYDPNIARFVSADPNLQFAQFTQSYDRYSYVLNNPLSFTDPTGFFLKKLFKGVGNFFKAVLNPIATALEWIKKNWRTVVVIAVAAVVTVGTGGIGGAILAGAISGGLNAALYGGGIDDILRGAVIGAAIGAATYGAGDLQFAVASDYGATAGWAASTGAHGVVGGVQSEIGGGNFWSGFASGAFTKALSGHVDAIESRSLRVTTAAAMGGTASVVAGGSFANGAITGAYSRLLNDELHFDGKKLTWKDDKGAVLAEYEAMSGHPDYQDPKYQNLKDKGPLPEGEYTVAQSQHQEMGDRGLFHKVAGELGFTAWPGGESAWGTQRIWITPRAGTNTYGRGGFTIHGGSSFGSRGCIDLCSNNNAFMHRFRSHGKDLKLTVGY